MEWFRLEREKELLTFPVLTASVLERKDRQGFMDESFVDYCAEEMAKGLSFFVYQSDSADSLSSCCRLRNELADNDFSYTLGAGGVVTGSCKVITMNVNKLFQRFGGFKELPNLVNRLHKYLTAFKN
jgi:ribonucleoside-triphosphate reductase